MGIITPPSGVGAGGVTIATPKNVISITTDTPGAPNIGDIYIVPVGATGAFSTHDNEIATFTDAGWVFIVATESDMAYVDDSDDMYLFTGVIWKEIETGAAAAHAIGGAIHIADTLANLNTKINDAILIAAWDEAQIYYVGKHGSDSNDGKSINKAFLTIGAAKTAAAAETPAADNRFVIKVLDAGIYTESLALTSWMKLDAPDAKIVGTLSLNDFTAAIVDTVVGAIDTDAVIRIGTAGECFIKIRQIFASSTGPVVRGLSIQQGFNYIDIDEINVSGVNNQGRGLEVINPSVTLVGRVKRIVCSSELAVRVSASAKVAVEIDRIDLSGITFGVVFFDEATEFHAKIGVIKDDGSGTAISLIGNNTEGTIIVGEIDCETAFEIGSSTTLNLIAAKITGDRAVSGTLNLAEAGALVESLLTAGEVDSAPLSNGSGGLVMGFPDAGNVRVEVRKGSAGTIAIGIPVYISGWNIGQEVHEVEAADASDPAKMPAIGLADVPITNSANAHVHAFGNVSDFDTTAFTVGDEVYVASGGGLTATKPTGTNLIQKIGEVLRIHATLGEVLVYGAGRQNDLPNLADGKIWQGNGSGVPQAVTPAAGGVLEKVLIRNYNGDGSNNREIDLDDDYNYVEIRIRSLVGSGDIRAAWAVAIGPSYSFSYNQSGAAGMVHFAMSPADSYWQGKMTGGNVTKIKLGSSGALAQGMNNATSLYVIIARKFSTVEA